jgi:hypothetical protein
VSDAPSVNACSIVQFTTILRETMRRKVAMPVQQSGTFETYSLAR